MDTPFSGRRDGCNIQLSIRLHMTGGERTFLEIDGLQRLSGLDASESTALNE